MKGEVYIKLSDGVNNYGSVISFVEVNDLIAECSRVPLSTKVTIDTTFTKQITTPDGDLINIGEMLRIDFDTLDMSEEMLTFLTTLLNNKVDVILYDPIDKGILYGVQNIIPSLKIINVSDYQTIHIAGQTANMDSLMFYKIVTSWVKINYPRNGFVYNKQINNIYGYIS